MISQKEHEFFPLTNVGRFAMKTPEQRSLRVKEGLKIARYVSFYIEEIDEDRVKMLFVDPTDPDQNEDHDLTRGNTYRLERTFSRFPNFYICAGLPYELTERIHVRIQIARNIPILPIRYNSLTDLQLGS